MPPLDLTPVVAILGVLALIFWGAALFWQNEAMREKKSAAFLSGLLVGEIDEAERLRRELDECTAWRRRMVARVAERRLERETHGQ